MAKKFKLVTLLGIRPDLIRMFKLIDLLDKGQKEHGYEHVFMHTGQHFDYELDGVFYEELKLRQPDFNLNVGKTLKERGGPTEHAYQTALLFERTAEMIEKHQPDAILYLGDTNSVLSSVIVARYGVPVIHIEGGGRSYDWRMPEEKNRIVIDHLSDMIYCYLPRYRDILLNEGIPPYRIKAVGNIIVDAVDEFLPRADKSDILKKLGVKPRQYGAATIHREENTLNQEIFTRIINDLMKLAEKLPVVLPVMPRVKGLLAKYGLMSKLQKSKVITTEPLGFLEFLKLEKEAQMIVSDSGTVQEEALILGVPALIARLSTERPETMAVGATILSNQNLYENALKVMTMPRDWNRNALNPSGKSPSVTIYEDLVYKIKDNYFQKNRSFDYVGGDFIVQQAYGKVIDPGQL